jgi:hypothetical protein
MIKDLIILGPCCVMYCEDELEKKLKKEPPAKLKKVRGKLNVPRERFHSVGQGQYKWAGLQFK